MVLHGNIFLSISALCSRIWIGTDYLNRNSLMSVEHHFECADGSALGPDGPRSGQSASMAGRSAQAQNRLGFRVSCYVCWRKSRDKLGN
jgi:hypothetical protein